MISYKSHKQGKSTFQITFDISNNADVKKLKALAIIMGAYNPLRHEATDDVALYDEMRDVQIKCLFDNMVYDICKLLK